MGNDFPGTLENPAVPPLEDPRLCHFPKNDCDRQREGSPHPSLCRVLANAGCSPDAPGIAAPLFLDVTQRRRVGGRARARVARGATRHARRACVACGDARGAARDARLHDA